VLTAAHVRCAVGEQGQVGPLGRLTTAPPWRMTSPGCSHDSDYARSLMATSHAPHREPRVKAASDRDAALTTAVRFVACVRACYHWCVDVGGGETGDDRLRGAAARADCRNSLLSSSVHVSCTGTWGGGWVGGGADATIDGLGVTVAASTTLLLADSRSVAGAGGCRGRCWWQPGEPPCPRWPSQQPRAGDRGVAVLGVDRGGGRREAGDMLENTAGQQCGRIRSARCDVAESHLCSSSV
jgi:hypothetical protein